MNKTITKLNAFTLAEVLITLGIIGVVAAMTMPTLIQNYRNHVVETRLQKVYSVMNQAIKQSELVNGEKENWDFDDNNFVQRYLLPFLKTIKVSEEKNVPYLEHGTFDFLFMYFVDGSLLVAKTEGAGKNNDYFFFPSAKNYREGIFNTFKHSGNLFFIFRFAPNSDSVAEIRHKRKGLEPYQYGVTNDTQLFSGSNYSCNLNSELPAYCTAVIARNGWKIPKDYPFKVR